MGTSTGIYIGFFGCWRADRVVCVGAPKGLDMKQLMSFRNAFWRTECPACKRHHPFQPLWRQATAAESKAKIEVRLKWSDKIAKPSVTMRQAELAGRGDDPYPEDSDDEREGVVATH